MCKSESAAGGGMEEASTQVIANEQGEYARTSVLPPVQASRRATPGRRRARSTSFRSLLLSLEEEDMEGRSCSRILVWERRGCACWVFVM